MKNLYPVIFTPIYKEMVWGGNHLAEMFGRTLPSDKVGESWDISCRVGEMGVVANGFCQGLTFQEYIETNKKGILGADYEEVQNFPLLVKIIDANQALSVQVHPSDAQASAQARLQINHNPDPGKSEIWYIIKPPTHGNLIIGLKPGTTKASLKSAFENNTVEEILNYLPVKAGDFVNIPPGLVHALTPGAMVLEIQQNSDTTYRMYDYNRLGLDGKPRQLHVEEAFQVADFSGEIPAQVVKPSRMQMGKNKFEQVLLGEHFQIEKLTLRDEFDNTTHARCFCIYTCVKGQGIIRGRGVSVAVQEGMSVFMPAWLGGYEIIPQGEMELIKSTPVLKEGAL